MIAIDRSGAGDKVAFLDPAAAPLGADNETGGTPPTEKQVTEAARHEEKRGTAAEHKQNHAGLFATSGRSSVALAVVLIILTIVGLVVALL